MDSIQQRREDNKKFSSPSKRRWNSKAGELITRANALKVPQISFQDSDIQNYSFLAKQGAFYLKKVEDCVRVEEMESLLDEADCIGIDDSENQYMLVELHKQVLLTQKSVEKLLESKIQPNFALYIQTLSKVTAIGVAFPSSDALKQILQLNTETAESIDSKTSIPILQTTISQLENNRDIVDPCLILTQTTRLLTLSTLKARSESLLALTSLASLEEESLSTLLTDIRKNKWASTLADKLKSLQKIVDILRRLCSGICDGQQNDGQQNDGQQNDGQQNLSPASKGTELGGSTNGDHNNSGNIVLSGIKDREDAMSLEGLGLSSGKKSGGFFEEDFDSELADVIAKIRDRIRDLDELDEIKESYRNLIGYSAGVLKDCRKVLELEDSELDILVNKLESLVWRSNARAVLNRNDECEVELTKVLNLAPKEIVKEGCREFSQVKERVHAIQAAISNEQRILAKLSEYWEYSELDHILEEVKNFVEETRNYILNKKVERQLEILEQVASALTPSNKNLNLEDLVEEMRDQKLASTLVFSKLNSLCKATEQAKKHRGQLNLHKKQLKKFRDNISSNSSALISLRDCFEMPRIKLDIAKEILHT